MTMIPSLHFSDDDGSRPMARNEIDGGTNITVTYRQNLRLHKATAATQPDRHTPEGWVGSAGYSSIINDQHR